MNKKSIIAISIITIMIMAGFTGLVYYNNPQIVNSNKTNISTEIANKYMPNLSKKMQDLIQLP